MKETISNLRFAETTEDETISERGYKQTEIGELPCDWDVKLLGELGLIVRGSSPRPAGNPRFFNGRFIPWLTVAALTNIPEHQLDVTETVGRLTEEGAKRSRVLHPNTLIIANSGATLGVAKLLRIRCCANDGIAAIIEQRQGHKIFLCQYINTQTDHLRSVLATGNGQPNLNTKLIREIRVPFPPLPEQRAIAEALSDVDGLIGALDKLIAKKRAIKLAAMQQLLTGKTRLPGFHGAWERKRLGEIASIRNQKILPANIAPETPCVELEHIGQNDGRLLDCSTAQGSTSTKYRFLTDDVLFGRLRSYLRKYWLADRDGICTTEIWPLAVNDQQAVASFLYAIVQTDWFVEASSISYGTHMPRADWGVMRNLEVHLPQVDEQHAIASVLSDMDAEIEALEKRRDKTKQIKQGMMQQLLTGKIRLVSPRTPAVQPEPEKKTTRKHSAAFNEAVVIATLAKRFGKEAFPLGRMRYTKLSYLLHRKTGGQVEGYLKKAAGPYNPKTRYVGPERIALENGYVREHHSGTYSGFVAAGNIAQAENYFETWYGAACLEWLEQFRYTKKDELELLTTVDMAAEELCAAGKQVEVAGVKSVLRHHPEWQAKLDRPIFSDANIFRAIEKSRELFGDNSGGAK